MWGDLLSIKFRLPVEEDYLDFLVVKGVVEHVKWEVRTGETAFLKTLVGKPFSLESLKNTSLGEVCPRLDEMIF